MTIDTHLSSRGTVLSIEGAAFDSAEAEELHELLLDLDPAQPLTIDIRSVRLVHDTAVAQLARDLQPAFRRVSILGLSEHHRRLMRYFGGGAEMGCAL